LPNVSRLLSLHGVAATCPCITLSVVSSSASSTNGGPAVLTRTVALMDWDNTLRRGFTIVDWARFLTDRNLFNPTVFDDLAATAQNYAKGIISYRQLSDQAPSLYAKGLSGHNALEVRKVASTFVDRDRRSLFGFTEPLHEFLHRRNIELVVISGAPIEVLDAFGKILGWSRVYGVTVDTAEGCYLPTLLENPAGVAAKRSIVREVVYGSDTLLALGDSESDVPLLDVAACKVVVDNDGVIADGPDVLRVKSTVDPLQLIARLTKKISSGAAQWPT
jgi:phosphoserine phosphatase